MGKKMSAMKAKAKEMKHRNARLTSSTGLGRRLDIFCRALVVCHTNPTEVR